MGQGYRLRSIMAVPLLNLLSRKGRDIDPAALRSKASLPLPGGRGGITTLVSTLTALLTQSSGVNWGREAGKLWENSTISIGLKWFSTTLPEAPFCVSRVRPGGAHEIIPDHPLTLLLRSPRGVGKRGGEAVPASNLWSATVLSLKVDGNAYWVLRRNEFTGKVVAIEYIPHWYIAPAWESDEEFISHYEYRVGSREMQKLDVADVIHFRDGIDPENTRKGLAALKAVLREVVSDNEATAYTAAILKNMGVPGVLITPKAGEAGKPAPRPSDGFKDRVKRLWRQITRGDMRGDAIVFDEAFDITMPGWSPEQLALDKIRQVPEAKLIAALQVPAMVVGLTVGDGQRTYSNMREAREMAYESSVLPLLSMLADTIQVQLLPQISGRADELCGFDLSEVRVLQTDMDALWKRAGEAWKAGGITRAEFRALLGYEVDEGRDSVFFTDVQAGSPAPEPAPPKARTAPTPAEAKAILLKQAEERRIKAERGETVEEEDSPPSPAPQPEARPAPKGYLPARRPNVFTSRN